MRVGLWKKQFGDMGSRNTAGVFYASADLKKAKKLASHLFIIHFNFKCK